MFEVTIKQIFNLLFMAKLYLVNNNAQDIYEIILSQQ